MGRLLLLLVGMWGLSCASIASLDDYNSAETSGVGGNGGMGGSASGIPLTGGGGVDTVGVDAASTGSAGGGGRPTTAYFDAVMDSGPTYYWRLGDTTVADAQPAMAATGPDGFYGGSGVSSVPGLVSDTDGAVAFEADGRMVVVGQELGDLSDGGPGSIQEGFTLELWFDAGAAATGTLVSLRGNNGWTFRLHLAAGALQFDLAPMNGGTGSIGPLPVAPGPHHVAATWKGGDANGMFVLCVTVDGSTANCSIENWASFDAPASRARLIVGGEETMAGGTTTAHIDGVIDEVAIYIPELDDNAIAEHYQVGLP